MLKAVLFSQLSTSEISEVVSSVCPRIPTSGHVNRASRARLPGPSRPDENDAAVPEHLGHSIGGWHVTGA